MKNMRLPIFFIVTTMTSMGCSAATASDEAAPLPERTDRASLRLTDPHAVAVAANALYTTNPNTGDLWKNSGTSWVRVGSPGSEFVGNDIALYALSPDRSGIWQFSGTPMSWTRIGGPAQDIYAGGTSLYATDPTTGAISMYNGTPMSWTPIGSSGAEFVANKVALYGLSPDRAGVWQFNRSTLGWTQVGSAAQDVFAGGTNLYATNPATGFLWGYGGTPMSWTQVGSPGSEFAANDAALYGLSPDRAGVWETIGTSGSWTHVGGAATDIFAGGGSLYATSPANGEFWRYNGNPMSWTDIGVPCPATDPGYLKITAIDSLPNLQGVNYAMIGTPLSVDISFVTGDDWTRGKTVTVLLDGQPLTFVAHAQPGVTVTGTIVGPVVTASTPASHTVEWTTACGTVTRPLTVVVRKPSAPQITLTASPLSVNASSKATLSGVTASDLFTCPFTTRLIGSRISDGGIVFDEASPVLPLTVTPTVSTTYTYTATCATDASISSSASAQVTVIAPPTTQETTYALPLIAAKDGEPYEYWSGTLLPIPGGVLKSLKNSNDVFTTKPYVMELVKIGHTTAECGNANAVIPLNPGQSTTDNDIASLLGTTSLAGGVTFVACGYTDCTQLGCRNMRLDVTYDHP